MAKVSVSVEAGSIATDRTSGETACTVLVVGSFDPKKLNECILKVAISLVDSDIEIKNVGTAARYSIVLVGDAARCSAIVRAIENVVKGDTTATGTEIILANNLLNR